MDLSSSFYQSNCRLPDPKDRKTASQLEQMFPPAKNDNDNLPPDTMEILRRLRSLRGLFRPGDSLPGSTASIDEEDSNSTWNFQSGS